MKKIVATLGFVLGMSGAAMAADAVVMPEPVPVTAGYSWNGAYVGGFVGYNWGSLDSGGRLCPNTDPRDGESPSLSEPQVIGGSSTNVGANVFGLPSSLSGLYPDYTCRPYETLPANGNNDGVGVFDSYSDDSDGFAWGGFVGVNRQYGKIVVGAELEGVGLDSSTQTREFSFAYFEDTNPLNYLRTVGGGRWTTDGPDWMAQGTVKAGYLFGAMDQALFYVKGGFAVGDKMTSTFIGGSTSSCSSCGGVFSQSLDASTSSESGYGFGGTIGTGLEYKFTENFSIGGEYQYTHLGYSGESTATHTMVRNITARDTREVNFTNTFEDTNIHMIKLKATWHFN